MKPIPQILATFGALLILSFILFSCSTPKRTALSCPEFSIKKNSKLAVDMKRNKAASSNYNWPAKKQQVKFSRKNQRNNMLVYNNSAGSDYYKITVTNSFPDLDKVDYSKGLIASIDNAIIPIVGYHTFAHPLKELDITEQPNDLTITQADNCDTIVLKSGNLLIGKVEEIGQTEIKYRKCNNLTGPIMTILKSDVSVIIFSNGTHEFIQAINALDSNQNNTTTNSDNTQTTTEALGIAGFVSSLVGLFIAGIPLGLVGVIFGGVSLSKIKKQPKKFSGKGFAIASIIIGIIAVIGAIIVIAAI